MTSFQKNAFIYGDRIAAEVAKGVTATEAAEAMRDTGIAVKTLLNYYSISQRIAHDRRMYDMSIAHHDAVRTLPKSMQLGFLKMVQKNRLGAHQLREEVIKWKRNNRKSKKQKPTEAIEAQPIELKIVKREPEFVWQDFVRDSFTYDYKDGARTAGEQK